MRPETNKDLVPPTELQFTDIGLAEDTLKILAHKVHLSDNLTPENITHIVEHYAALLFPDKQDHPNAYGWVLYQTLHDIIDLSYFVTTHEGKKFRNEYWYLLH